jgi:hypothetical protein
MLIDTLAAVVQGSDDDTTEPRHDVARLMFEAFQPRDAIEARPGQTPQGIARRGITGTRGLRGQKMRALISTRSSVRSTCSRPWLWGLTLCSG